MVVLLEAAAAAAEFEGGDVVVVIRVFRSILGVYRIGLIYDFGL